MRRIVTNYLALLRPHQWIKNLLLLFPPFFGGRLSDPAVLTSALPALCSFSLAASACYILNDINDRADDRHHATKRSRPLARGEISAATAAIIAAVLYVTAIVLSSSLSDRFEGYLILYFFASLFYTLFFRSVVLLDIFFIAATFLIRVLAGGEAFGIPVSNWLFLTVFVVALLLASGKRVGESLSLGENASKHRKVFRQYPPAFLNHALWFFAGASLVTYMLYTVENRHGFYYTVPFVAFGLLRYILIVNEGKGDPTTVLLTDRQILITGICWLLLVALIIYR